MPNRRFPTHQTPPYHTSPNGSNEWDALKGELEGLLDQVHGQIAEYEHQKQDRVQQHYEPVRRYGTDDGAHDFVRQDHIVRQDHGHQDDGHSASTSQDVRRQDALRQVQSAVARMGRKQEAPQNMSQDMPDNAASRLDRAVAQIRARQEQISPPSPRQDNAPMAERSLHDRPSGRSAPETPSYVKEIIQGMEGLHRSVRDLANQNLQTDPEQFSSNFSQIERRINELGDLLGRHSDPAFEEMGQRLDQLMKSTERLAEIQIKQMAQFEAYRENNQVPEFNLDGLENGIHNLYERLDSLERTASAPPKELDTIARSVAGIASAVGHLQQDAMAQKLPEIYTQLQQISEHISSLDDKHSTRVTDHIRREMQGVRSEVTGLIEPRFDSIEARLEGLQENLTQEPGEAGSLDLSELHAIEERLNEAIASLDRARASAPASSATQNNDDVLGALSTMEDRLNAAIESIDRAQQDSSAPQDNLFQCLKGMEDRIVDAIHTLRTSAAPSSAPQEAPNLDLTGLKAIEDRLHTQLEVLDVRLQAALKHPGSAASAEPAKPVVPHQPPVDHFAAWNDAAETEPNQDFASESAQPETARPAPSFEEAIGLDQHDGETSHSVGLGFADPGADASAPAPALADIAAPALQHEDPADTSLNSLAPALHPAEKAPDFAKDDLPPEPHSSFRPANFTFDEGPRSLTDFDEGSAPEPTAAYAPEMVSTPAAAKPREAAAPQDTLREGQAQDETLNHARQSFIAAARSAAVAKNDTPDQTTSLLGRAFARIKAGKDQADEKKTEPSVADVPKPDRLSAGANHLHAASAAIEDDAEEMEEAAEQRRKRFMMPFGSKKKAQPAAAEAPERPHSPFDNEHSISLEGHPDHRDAEGDDDADEDQAKESFLSRHRQPILLGASIIAIVAMTANLINQNSAQSGNAAPNSGDGSSISAPAEADLSALEGLPSPRQIDMSQAPVLEVGELAAMTDQNALAEQNVGLVAPQPDNVDQKLTTASISPEPRKASIDTMTADVGPEGLRMAAAAGDVRAQFEMAAILVEGQAVPKDSQAAAKWFEKAAAAGYAPAQYRLAAAFEHGIGVPKNIGQAKEWYKRAAENGNRMAMHNLAALYASANEDEQDFSKASVWFKRAADQGVVDSQFNLGMLYARGLGVQQDLNQSYFWFALAALQGDQDAKGARDDVARSIDAAQMQTLKDQVASWQAEEVSLGSNYAPIGTWDPAFDPGPAIDKKEIVLGVQSALLKLGFSVGEPDGVIGPKTRDAIRGFERALGMNESGTINPRLMAILSSQPI